MRPPVPPGAPEATSPPAVLGSQGWAQSWGKGSAVSAGRGYLHRVLNVLAHPGGTRESWEAGQMMQAGVGSRLRLTYKSTQHKKSSEFRT